MNASLAHQLNMLVTETGMSFNVRQTGYLQVADLDLVTEPSKPILEKPLKLKEKKRWIQIDRQRLTYYNTRSTKKIKGSFVLDSRTTRMSIAPPLPTETHGLIEYTKDYTIKIENDDQKLILYLRCSDAITFREWHQAIATRLMPSSLRKQISNYSPKRR